MSFFDISHLHSGRWDRSGADGWIIEGRHVPRHDGTGDEGDLFLCGRFGLRRRVEIEWGS
jgi:hypothetical protein